MVLNLRNRMNTAKNALPMAVNSINKVIVDTEVTPIYPVRYAYANFFEETLFQKIKIEFVVMRWKSA